MRNDKPVTSSPAIRTFALCLMLAPLAQAASTDGSSERDQRLDPVVVEGTRSSLNEMRQQMIQLEDRFFERYNELNTNDDFDTHCYMETRAGTLLKRRFCRAVYQTTALETAGREYAEFLKATTAPPNANPADKPPEALSGGGPPSPAVMAYAARQKEYQQNMIDVTRGNAELVGLLSQCVELEKRYDATRRKAFGLNAATEGEDAASAAPAPR